MHIAARAHGPPAAPPLPHLCRILTTEPSRIRCIFKGSAAATGVEDALFALRPAVPRAAEAHLSIHAPLPTTSEPAARLPPFAIHSSCPLLSPPGHRARPYVHVTYICISAAVCAAAHHLNPPAGKPAAPSFAAADASAPKRPPPSSSRKHPIKAGPRGHDRQTMFALCPLSFVHSRDSPPLPPDINRRSSTQTPCSLLAHLPPQSAPSAGACSRLLRFAQHQTWLLLSVRAPSPSMGGDHAPPCVKPSLPPFRAR
jgi:hypothetical protein